ncbi:hypothetical protein K443DRAFT_674817 [Laccaria amethystina LaAM-08-1]|uniref:Uncharacterized protein n=1 Tax=Laccaria amethystina LaAM-08-1 TaxID=1095629 RepID=A0A0C9Y691_9AGAR|nr:hypothetical protein K443DRAFT_674817 [Laccaria amethystina LaAM-08-1]
MLSTAQEPKRAQDILKAKVRGDVERDEEARLRTASDGCVLGLIIARSDSPCFPGAWS